jgi:hypothetical protein
MNRLLILLFMVGWAFYLVQVNSGGRSVAVRSEQNAKASGLVTAGQQPAASSGLQPVARAAVDSPHAIVPDEAPAKPAVSAAVSPPANRILNHAVCNAAKIKGLIVVRFCAEAASKLPPSGFSYRAEHKKEEKPCLRRVCWQPVWQR